MDIIAFKYKLLHFFDLREDTEYFETEKSIRKNSEFKSDNSWNLVFAIIIASIGLNVNSTAVIIGAMLISPLMGPIIGIGFGLGINDSQLLKLALRNLIFAVTISLLSSAAYFIFSPISIAQSEIVSRTYPTFFDVLIALFGGAAGIVAISRKEKSNAIPGVAIATALMPPLCTAGFGIATLNFSYFIGAIYLFTINSVFIAIATYFFVRLLKFKRVTITNNQTQKRINKIIISISTLLIIPSVILAWQLLNEFSFKTKVDNFIEKSISQDGIFVVNKQVHFSWINQEIDLTLMGNKIDDKNLAIIKLKMIKAGLDPNTLKIRYITDQNMYDEIKALKTHHSRLTDLEAQNLELKNKVNEIEKVKSKNNNMLNEIQIFLQQVDKIDSNANEVSIYWKNNPSKYNRTLAEKFIQQKFHKEIKIKHLIIF